MAPPDALTGHATRPIAMQKPLRNELVKHFKTGLEARFPRFQELRLRRDTWTWGWRLSDDLTLFVMLYTSNHRDRFVVEIAWSNDGIFPWTDVGLGALAERAHGRESLTKLMAPSQQAEAWNLSPEQSAADDAAFNARVRGETPLPVPDLPLNELLPRVQPLVQHVIEQLEQFAIPLFRRLAEMRNIPWPVALSQNGDPGR